MPEPSDWLSSVTAIVETVTSRWALAGAFAAERYRLGPRNTTDLDIYAPWSEQLLTAFESAGYSVRKVVDPSVGYPHLLICRRDVEMVDIMCPVTEYQELALDRATPRHVLTVEDVIVHKLIAWRDKDKDDIASILAAGHDLDRDYIERWADEWDVTDRWRDATRER